MSQMKKINIIVLLLLEKVIKPSRNYLLNYDLNYQM